MNDTRNVAIIAAAIGAEYPTRLNPEDWNRIAQAAEYLDGREPDYNEEDTLDFETLCAAIGRHLEAGMAPGFAVSLALRGILYTIETMES